MINISNYEEWFLLYADGELTVAEQEAVLQFVADHAHLREELDLLLSMRFQPEEELILEDHSTLESAYFEALETTYRFEPDLTIQFPDKQLLYKKTSSPVITMFRYAAVAASVVLTAGLIWWFSGSADVEQSVAQVDVISPSSSPVESTTSVDLQTPIVKTIETVRKPLSSVGEKRSQQKSNIPTITNVSNQEAIVQDMVINETATIAMVAVSGQANFSQEAIAAAEARMNKATTIIPAVQNANAINTAMLIEAELEQDRPAPARGLLRKISRTLLGEREEESDQKYVQFAVFQIPVKQ